MYRVLGAVCRRSRTLGIAVVLAASLLPAAPAIAYADSAGKAPDLPRGLESALARDLQLTPEEFTARRELAHKAAQIAPELEELDGFVSITLSRHGGDRLVVTGTGRELERIAQELDAEVIAPVEASTKTVPDMPRNPVKTADSPGELLREYVDAFGAEALQNLQAVMQDASGEYVIRAAPPASARSARVAGTAATPKEFTRQYTNVEFEAASGSAEPLAELPGDAAVDTLVGGLGILGKSSQGSFVCSMGFNAFSPTGVPAVLSAGHCTADGSMKDVYLADRSSAPAADPSSTTDPHQGFMDLVVEDRLGTYGFSQFGGAGNSPYSGQLEEPGNAGTDVSVIEDLNPKYPRLPAVTNWKNSVDAGATGPLVTGTTEPALGAPVCKSGRTTGWVCGTIDEVGLFLVDGYGFDPADIRVIKGFGSAGMDSEGGDSGGPMVSGTLALGVTSAGGYDANGVEWTYGASIGPMLATIPGYTLQRFVAAPELTSHNDGGTVTPGALIQGNSPVGTEVHVLLGEGPVKLATAANGTWSLTAPETSGVFKFGVYASRGFSTSDVRWYEMLVETPEPAVPDPQEPAEQRDGAPGSSGPDDTGSTFDDSGGSEPNRVEPVPAGPSHAGPAPESGHTGDGSRSAVVVPAENQAANPLPETGAPENLLLLGSTGGGLLAAGMLFLWGSRYRRLRLA